MTGSDLIRKARSYAHRKLKAEEAALFRELAAALEERGAQLERANEDWQVAVGIADRRALAAEAERDRLRAMAREIEQIILPDPYDERETDRGWMRDRIRAAIDAALTAEGQRGET